MNQTLFRDALFNLVLIFFVLLVLLLPHVNPPAEEAKSEPPGNVIVHITWPSGSTDVDLWMFGPGELKPVGYSNKGGRLWNLLRDDLGQGTDATNLNYENGFTRGVVPGDYVINVHCFRCPQLPVPVEVEVSVAPNDGGQGKQAARIIATSTVELRSKGQERTAIRFTLDAEGNLDPASLNTVFQPLRSGFK